MPKFERDDLFYALGGELVVLGIALVCVPAALVVAGIALGALGYLTGRT